jgi:hypothetical protein
MQKIHLVNALACSLIGYGMGVACYPPSAIDKMDCMLLKVAKRAMGLPCDTPLSWLWADTRVSGMGLHCLAGAQDVEFLGAMVNHILMGPDSPGKAVLLSNVLTY